MYETTRTKHNFNHLLSRISNCRLTSPSAENRSSFIRVSALKLFSKCAFLSCSALSAGSRISHSLWFSLQRAASFSNTLHLNQHIIYDICTPFILHCAIYNLK